MEVVKEVNRLIDKFTFASIYFTDGEKGALLNAKFCALKAAELCRSESYKQGTEISIIRQTFWNSVIYKLNKINP